LAHASTSTRGATNCGERDVVDGVEVARNDARDVDEKAEEDLEEDAGGAAAEAKE
jgi:hypothetical protein